MQIFVSKDGQQSGPFSVDEIKKQISSGILTPQDHGWHEGLSEWQTLETLEVLAAGQPVNAGPPLALPKEASSGPQERQSRKTSALAITSLVLGICSYVLCLSVLSGIPAIVCGHVALGKIRRAKARLKGKGLAIAGLVLGYVSIGFAVFMVPVMLGVAAPAFKQGFAAATAAQSLVNVRQISAACQAYAKAHDGKYPDSLDQLNLANKNVLVSPLADGKPGPSYIYIPGFTSSSPGDSIFLYDKNVPKFAVSSPQLKMHVVARVNGVCEIINDEDFAREVKPAAP